MSAIGKASREIPTIVRIVLALHGDFVSGVDFRRATHGSNENESQFNLAMLAPGSDRNRMVSWLPKNITSRSGFG